ncbi:hypothetical protein G9C98_007110 [Cotesia typhae]|uniref:Succinate dehydrogenase [ubiquinone] cytochrome b small subunit n=1 Tax=Cotesia typhae TaxID=2053667 RepID=A0A8J5V1C6_9HYME|nr:hypothetical protein G9C98_007110 [Cotesia typhae]
MAYLSRCQIGRTLPTLAKLIGSNPAFVQRNVAPAAVRVYSSTSFTKNVARLSLQSINQLKKFPGTVSAFASQIRSSSTHDHVLLPKILMGTLYAISVATLAGLGALIYNGPGVSGSIKKIWEMGNK